jgi:hypothetical protein
MLVLAPVLELLLLFTLRRGVIYGVAFECERAFNNIPRVDEVLLLSEEEMEDS